MEKPNHIATVGQLRTALEAILDDTPLIVNAAYPGEPQFVDEQVITSTGFGVVDWGGGHGLERDTVFALNCHVDMLSEHVPRKPIRAARQATAQTAPAAEPEAGP